MRFEAFTQPGPGGFWPWPIAPADRWVLLCPPLPLGAGIATSLWFPAIAGPVWVLVVISIGVMLEWIRRYLLARSRDGPTVAAFAADNAMRYERQTLSRLPGELFTPTRDVYNVVTAPGLEIGTHQKLMDGQRPRLYLRRSYAAVHSAVPLPRLVLSPYAVWGSYIGRAARGQKLPDLGRVSETFAVYGADTNQVAAFLGDGEELCRAAGRCDIETVGEWALIYHLDGPVRSSAKHWQNLTAAAAAVHNLIRRWEARGPDPLS